MPEVPAFSWGPGFTVMTDHGISFDLEQMEERDKLVRAHIAEGLRDSKEPHELIAIYVRLFWKKHEEGDSLLHVGLFKMLEKDIQEQRYLEDDICYKMQMMLNDEFWDRS